VTTGRLQPLQVPKRASNFVAAIVTLPNREPFSVVSLRLQPPVFSLEYWNPACWREYANNRSSRRQELAEVADWINRQAGSMSVIVGGDYNSPPDKRLFSLLGSDMRDATFDSGYTAVNEFPLARIDQIWVKGFTPKGSRAVLSHNSDHQKVFLWLD
jgi:endonuclease/exonuclease/phosphatase (EEP) superfamily protein YafD